MAHSACSGRSVRGDRGGWIQERPRGTHRLAGRPALVSGPEESPRANTGRTLLRRETRGSTWAAEQTRHRSMPEAPAPTWKSAHRGDGESASKRQLHGARERPRAFAPARACCTRSRAHSNAVRSRQSPVVVRTGFAPTHVLYHQRSDARRARACTGSHACCRQANTRSKAASGRSCFVGRPEKTASPIGVMMPLNAPRRLGRRCDEHVGNSPDAPQAATALPDATRGGQSAGCGRCAHHRGFRVQFVGERGTDFQQAIELGKEQVE